jgi:hypothetical protein
MIEEINQNAVDLTPEMQKKKEKLEAYQIKQMQLYFRVDPERHEKNKLDKLSRYSVNPYTGQPIIVERNVKQVSKPDLSEKRISHIEKSRRRDPTWTREDLRIYLEKFFIYRRDFVRIQ